MKSNKEDNIQDALNNIQNMMSRTDLKKMQDDILELTSAEIAKDIKISQENCNNFFDIRKDPSETTKQLPLEEGFTKRPNAGDTGTFNDNLTDSIQTAYLEKIVKDLLRPELTIWLNANLPRIVEEIVEREIKRII